MTKRSGRLRGNAGLMGAWESARNVAGPFNTTNEPQSGAGGSETPTARRCLAPISEESDEARSPDQLPRLVVGNRLGLGSRPLSVPVLTP